MNKKYKSVPILGSEILSRKQLLQTLNLCNKQLIFLQAMSGFGKTTLLTQWYERTPRLKAWHTFEKSNLNDYNSVNILVHNILKQLAIHSVILEKYMDQRTVFSESSIFIDAILTELEGLNKQVWLVLDNLEHVHNPHTHQFLSDLLIQLPDNVSVIMASQNVPECISKNHKILSSKLYEIYQSQLGFTETETQLLFNEKYFLNLEDNNINDLLQLSDASPLVLHQMAYFLSNGIEYIDLEKMWCESAESPPILEVVKKIISPDFQQWLYKISVLDDFSFSLVQNVIETPHTEEYLRILSELPGVLIKTGREDSFDFQVHPLLREQMRKQSLSQDPIGYYDRCKRVSQWYEDRSYLIKAFDFLCFTDNRKFIIDFVKRHAFDLLKKGEIYLLNKWFELLRWDEISNNEHLVIPYFWVLVSSYKFDQLSAAIDSLQTWELSELARAHIYSIQARLALFKREPDNIIKWSHLASDLMYPVDSLIQALDHYHMGIALLLLDRQEQAQIKLKNAISVYKSLNQFQPIISAMTILARNYYICGKLVLAEQTYQQALMIMDQNNIASIRQKLPVYHGLAMIYYCWNDLDKSASMLGDSLTLKHPKIFSTLFDEYCLLAQLMVKHNTFPQIETLINELLIFAKINQLDEYIPKIELIQAEYFILQKNDVQLRPIIQKLKDKAFHKKAITQELSVLGKWFLHQKSNKGIMKWLTCEPCKQKKLTPYESELELKRL